MPTHESTMKVTDRRGDARSKLRLTSLGVGTSAIGGLYAAAACSIRMHPVPEPPHDPH